MQTLWKLPRAAVELAVGTMIVMVHLGLAARIERKALAAGQSSDPRRDAAPRKSAN
jgi:hypothetical protein